MIVIHDRHEELAHRWLCFQRRGDRKGHGDPGGYVSLIDVVTYRWEATRSDGTASDMLLSLMCK
jgi:hypothetical protein